MNYYWHTPEGKIIQAVFGAKDAEVLASPLSEQYAFVATEDRIPHVSQAYIDTATGQLVPKGEPLTPKHTWDYPNKSWQDKRSLAQAKAEKAEEITKARAVANKDSFTFQGKEIACDPLSRSDIDAISGYVALMGEMPPNWIGVWKTKDNSYLAIPNVVVWKQFYTAMVAKGQSNFDKSEQLKAQITQAATTAEADAVQWD